MASFGPLDHQQTHLIRVQPGELNLGRLSALDDVVQAVLDGTQTPQEGSARIDKILTKKPTYPWWLRVFGYGNRVGGRLQISRRRIRRRDGQRVGGAAHRPDRAGVQTLHDHLARVRVDGVICRLGAGDLRCGAGPPHLHSDETLAGIITLAAWADDHSRDDGAGKPAPVFRQRATELGVHRVCRDDLWRRAGHDGGGGNLWRPRAQLRARASAAVDAVCGAGAGADWLLAAAARAPAGHPVGVRGKLAGISGVSAGRSSTWARFWGRRWGRSPSGS